MLDGALERAIAGEPTAVLVGGEAGVGKSRLVHELSRRAEEAGARVLVGGCVEVGGEGIPFGPLVEVLRPIPGPAYLPILVLFVGIGHEMKVTLIFLASLFPILLNTYSGVRSIDRVQLDTARTLGLTTLQTFRELVLPAASPQILTGMRISLAISLILAILGEMIVSNDGLGYFVLLAQRTFKVPDMYAGIFTLALLGYMLNRLFLMIESRLIRWHTESSGRT